MIDPAQYTASSGRNIHRYSANSAASSSVTTLSDPGYYYGYNAGSIRSITMNSNGETDVQDAIDGNGAGSSGHILGLAVRNSVTHHSGIGVLRTPTQPTGARAVHHTSRISKSPTLAVQIPRLQSLNTPLSMVRPLTLTVHEHSTWRN